MIEQIVEAMKRIYGASYCLLYVRMSNRPAVALYKDALAFKVASIEENFCEYFWLELFLCYYTHISDSDGEDALAMKLDFDPEGCM